MGADGRPLDWSDSGSQVVKPKSQIYKEWKTLLGIIAVAAIGAICFGFGMFFQSHSTKPEIQIKEIPKEIVHYVEKSKTPTEEFLIHLNDDLDPQLAKLIAVEVDKNSEKYRRSGYSNRLEMEYAEGKIIRNCISSNSNLSNFIERLRLEPYKILEKKKKGDIKW